MSLNPNSFDQASFIRAREPSVWGWDQRKRFVAPVRKQLLNEILEEDNRTPEKTAINTYLRLKPSSPSEQTTLSVLNETTIATHAPKDSATFKFKSSRVVHQYSFSKVFGVDTSQKEIFDESAAFQVKDFILGRNCLIFAYGTTNAGKTYTIQGNGSYPGVIPRSIDLLFKSIKGQVAGVGRYKPDKVEGIVRLDSATIAQELDYKNRILHWNWDKALEPIKCATNTSHNISSGSESDFISNTFREMQKTLSNDSPLDVSCGSEIVYGVWVSFAEVYNEYIYDLLDPVGNRHHKRTPLKMAQDSEGIAFIRDLKMIHVTSGDEAFHVMLYGKENLQVAATNLNTNSSRSHCIFSIRLVRYANCDEPSYATVSTFTFCDLAGAERSKKTLNVGERLKESNNINTSLHVLGRCMSIIRENQRKNEKKPVPYRDSKLTRIFQRALTGHERITMIVNANTSPILFDETMNVLNFSAIAKQIVLETPIKRANRPVKQSRFSMMVSQPNPHGTICWDAPPDLHGKTSTSSRLSSGVDIEKYNAQNEELIALVEKLKDQVARERQRNLTLEKEIRQEVTDTFSQMITKMENSHRERLREAEENSESLSTWRINQLENYYKQQLEGSRKRRRESVCDESVVECDSTAMNQQFSELQQEVEVLEEKYNAVHQLLKEAREIQSSLSAENSSLKFELANVNAELEKCQRQLLASENQLEGCSNALIEELKLQISAAKQKAVDETSKNETLKEILEEAKQEFLMLTKDKEESDNDVIKLQNELLEEHDKLIEVTQQLEATQQLLSQKSHDLEKFEEKHDNLAKAHELAVKDFDKISVKDRERAMQGVEELQSLLQLLSVSDESSSKPVQECSKDESKTTSDLSELITALRCRVNMFENLRAELNSTKLQLGSTQNDLKCKEEQVLALRQNVNTLESQPKSGSYEVLKSGKDKDPEADEPLNSDKLCIIASLEQEKMLLQSELKQLKEDLSKIANLKDDYSTRLERQQGEIKLLQKDLKDMLQKNIGAEEKNKEIVSELECCQQSNSRMEKELKAVLQKSTSQLNMSSSSQIELESLRFKDKSYDENMKLFQKWKEEADLEKSRLKQELKKCQEEIQRREEDLRNKETEIESVLAHRSELINRYDEALKKNQEELEREKREVIRLRDTLYKSTPTPKKDEKAKIRQLQDQVESLQTEISSLKRVDNLSSSSKKNAKKGSKQESNLSNESIKENVVESFPVPSTSKSSGTTNVDCKDLLTSDSKLKQVKDSSIPAEPANEKRPQRKNRRLFSHRNNLTVDDNDEGTVEVAYIRQTTPESYVKRSLRNRKV